MIFRPQTADTMRRILSRYYARYDAAYRDNAPRSLLAHYREVLASDFDYIGRREQKSDRAAFIAEWEREAKAGRFTDFVAVLTQKTTPGAVEVGDDSTIVLHITEERVTVEYDLDTPTTGPDGLSGHPQPQEVKTTLQWRDTWVRHRDVWRMKRREFQRGRVDASYLTANEMNKIKSCLPQNRR